MVTEDFTTHMNPIEIAQYDSTSASYSSHLPPSSSPRSLTPSLLQSTALLSDVSSPS